MPDQKDSPKGYPLRFDEPETHSKLLEMCEHYDRSINKMINICIKEQYKVFKAKKG